MYTAPSHHDPRSLEVHSAVVNVYTVRCYKTEPVFRFGKQSGHEHRGLPVSPSGNQQNCNIFPPLQNTIKSYRREIMSVGEQLHNIGPSNQAHLPSPQPQPRPVTAFREDPPDSSGATDVMKYLIRREMVSSGLLKFDDHPKNYRAWKSSFLSNNQYLNLTAREELDLLSK
jgi:hypothetical protein